MNDRAIRLRLAIVIVVLLAVAVVADRTTSTSTSAVPRATPVPAAALARGDVRSAAWYCPLAAPRAGIEAGDAVFVANTAPRAVTVEISGLGGGLRRAVRRVQVPASGSLTFAANTVAGPHGEALLIEPFGPGIVVEHRAVLAHAPSAATPAVAPCATSLHDTWYFPALTTTRGATSVVALFNPLARTDVVVDVSLYTPAGERRPGALQGLAVPRRSRVLITTNTYADREPVLAMAVRVRSGGRIAAEAAVSIGSAIAVSLGASRPADRFWFASGSRSSARSLYVLNIGDTAADVGVQIVPVASQQTVPVTVHVSAGAVAAVDLGHLAGARDYSVVVGVPRNAAVVVADLEQRPPTRPGLDPGLSSAVGVAAPAGTWALAAGIGGVFNGVTLDVLDPGATAAHVTVRLADGRTQTATVQPGDRVAIALLRGAPSPFVVQSDQPVVVERVLRQPAGATRTTAVPGP